MKSHRFLQHKYTVSTYRDRGLIFVAGKGVYLYDERGTFYYDLMTNYGVNIFGHAHPLLTERLSNQMHRLSTLHGSFVNDRRAEAAQNLVRRCGGGLSRVFFSNSGSEAVEAALKFAVLATGRKKFISCEKGYHGKTLGALSLSGDRRLIDSFVPLLWDNIRVPFNDLGQLEGVLDDRTAAFIVEPIQGEGGIHIPDPGFIKGAKKLCASKGVLLIIDEIQTGLGRTGNFLASQPEGIDYDILCLGKGLAGGIPVGATLVNDEVAAHIPKSIHTSTFGGNPLSCEGINVTLELLDENVLHRNREFGLIFLEGLRDLPCKNIRSVRGKGLMIGLEISGDRNLILKKLQESQILAAPAGEDVVRFLPPFILEKSDIENILQALKKIMIDIEAGKGQVSCADFYS